MQTNEWQFIYYLHYYTIFITYTTYIKKMKKKKKASLLVFKPYVEPIQSSNLLLVLFLVWQIYITLSTRWEFLLKPATNLSTA